MYVKRLLSAVTAALTLGTSENSNKCPQVTLFLCLHVFKTFFGEYTVQDILQVSAIEIIAVIIENLLAL